MVKKKKQPAKRSRSTRKVPSQTRSKKSVQGLGKNLYRVQELLQLFENEVGSLVGKITKQSKKSRLELSHVFEEIVSRLSSTKDFAGLQKQAKRLSEDVLRSIKDVEALSERVNLALIAHEVKHNLAHLMDQLSQSGLLQKAKQSVYETKEGVFQLLNIPTQSEVVQLERKIVSLERKLSSISRRAA